MLCASDPAWFSRYRQCVAYCRGMARRSAPTRASGPGGRLPRQRQRFIALAAPSHRHVLTECSTRPDPHHRIAGGCLVARGSIDRARLSLCVRRNSTMFGLIFLAVEKKKALEKLQSHLTYCTTPLERNETQLMIQEILNQAKPYQQCDLAEAEELKLQLLSKINILTGLGKLGSVEPFRMHLADVEYHIATKQMEEKLTGQRKLKPDEPPRLRDEDKTPTINSMKREKKKKQAFGHQRFMIGFEDDDVDTKHK